MVDLARYFLSFTQSDPVGNVHPAAKGQSACWKSWNALRRVRVNLMISSDWRSWRFPLKIALLWAGADRSQSGAATLRYSGTNMKPISLTADARRVCKDLLCYYIDPELCIGCRACTKACRLKLSAAKRKSRTLLMNEIIRCGACFERARKCCKNTIILE